MSPNAPPEPPTAPFIPSITHHTKNPTKTKSQLKPYLQLENQYTEYHISQKLEENLFQELKGFVSLKEASYPSAEKHFVYYWRISEGDEYKKYYRTPVDKWKSLVENHHPDTPYKLPANIAHEELILDVNELASQHKYCDIGWISISPNEEILSYGVDYTGDELYEIVVQFLGGVTEPPEGVEANQVLDRYRIIPPEDEDEDDEDDEDETSHTTQGETEGTQKDSSDDEADENNEDDDDSNQDEEEDCGIAAEFEWAEDNQTYFYVTVDESQRAFRVYRHHLSQGSSHEEDDLLFEEKDERFSVAISKCLSNDVILIETASSNTTEYHWIDAHNPQQDPHLILKRQEGIEYHVDHSKETSEFIMWTNSEERENFALIKCAMNAPALKPPLAQEVIPYDKDVFIEDALVFHHFIALSVRRAGVMRCLIVEKHADSSSPHNVFEIPFADSVYEFYFKDNSNYESTLLRLKYSSPVTTPTIFEFDTRDRKLHTRKVYNVPGFHSEDYSVASKIVQSRDGSTEIPLTLIYKRHTQTDSTNIAQLIKKLRNGPVSGQNQESPNQQTEESDGTKQERCRPVPTLLTAYGAYCLSNECHFSSNILPLLNRGILYVIAHVRGGGEKGRHWYDQGKLLNKNNTFFDFVDVAQDLVDCGVTNRENLCIYGASAGGLTMGAAVNLAPHLFKGAVLDVPFVNVLETMTNPNIPLTTLEYLEFGDPRKEEVATYMKSYSPIDNIHRLAGAEQVPNMLVLSGLNDPRVSYLEPTAYCCRLRQLFAEKKNASNLLLLKTNLEAGHCGASGRFEQLREWALIWSFVIGELLD